MFTVITWTRILFVALALSAFAPSVSANADSQPVGTSANHPTGRGAATKSGESGEGRPRAGSPEFGVLIIIGAVAFVVIVAWIIARTLWFMSGPVG